MIETAAVIELLGKLKDLKRSGWVMKKVSAPESVADHSWGVALLAVLLTPEGLDGHKCLQLAIVHDLQESIVGDITPADGIGREEKSRRERAAVGLLAEKLNFPELKALFEEFEALETPEARFVKDLDRIEAVLQGREEGLRANPDIKIGIILCTDKPSAKIEYVLGGLENRIFASRYVLYLPEKEALEEEVQAYQKQARWKY